MAHEVETMAYANETPWHGLGTKVIDDLTPEQMMQKAGVDWEVVEVPNFIEFDGRKRPTGMKTLVRETDGQILTTVGKDWKPVQNRTAFEFFDDFIAAGDMKMDTAGSLRNGQRVWALAKINEGFELFNGDRVEPYLLFSNPHIYGRSIDIQFTPIRVVCNNTLSASLRLDTKNRIRLNHRKDFDADLVKTSLQLSTEKLNTFKEMAEHLGSKRCEDADLDLFITRIFGESKKKEEKLTRTGNRIKELVAEQPGAKFAEGSWWQAFNAVTYWFDHEYGRTSDARMDYAWFGPNKNKKINALDVALEMADAA